MKAITKFSQLDLKKQYTYADYLTWKFNERVELIKGWIHKMSPAPNVIHQRVLRILSVKIVNTLKNSPCEVFFAPFDVRLFKKSIEDEKVLTVVQPDLCIVCDSKKLDEKGCLGAPEFVIEIVSPGNSKKDLQLKFNLYQDNSVQEYWVVEPIEQSIHQFVLTNNKFELIKIYFTNDKIESKLFKTLKFKLNTIFG